MKRLTAQFDDPFRVSIREEPIPGPSAGEALVRTLYSGISAGTELLVYRGRWPEGFPLDETIPSLRRPFGYPVTYGYSCVGQVVGLGRDVDPAWEGATVFAFNPHQSHFTVKPTDMIRLPDTIAPESAALLPSLETAVNLVTDGRPRIGECVAILGLGVVGLLTAAVSALMRPATVVAFDGIAKRRAAASVLGAHITFGAADPDAIEAARSICLEEHQSDGFDLTYELTGNPAALEAAIELTGFGGRIIVGSWYGAKRAPIDLGGSFHRRRISLIGSQVSTLAPDLTPRWTNRRRMKVALGLLESLPCGDLVTHRFPIRRADEAYSLLDEAPEEAIQVVFTYEEE